MQSPELFPRPDGTTYVCAISSESPLPIDPAAVRPDPDAIEQLERMCTNLSPVLASSSVLARQACYRPITRDGLPLIGRLAGIEGAYVATGHSVWGVLNAPGTGEAMSELIIDGNELQLLRGEASDPQTLLHRRVGLGRGVRNEATKVASAPLSGAVTGREDRAQRCV